MSHGGPWGGPVSWAIVGGSGLYKLAGLADVEEISVDTPFGPPSDQLLVGSIEGRRVAFLARHGRGHGLLPGEVNYRANTFALKRIGVQRILSASAVGSMREEIRPRDVVLIDQFLDRTRGRPSTFFGCGLVAHVSFADPVCSALRRAMLAAARKDGVQAHDGGCYVCIEGPAFSTRFESELYRSWGVSVIGMTNLQEAKLAREAEMCYATLAMVTDYDCWHDDEQDVTVEGVLGHLKANAGMAARVLRDTIHGFSEEDGACDCARALAGAIITPREEIPAETKDRLAPIVGKYLDDGHGA